MTPLLLIDDDAELCAMLAEYLAGEGFAVTAVHDGEAGLAAAREGGHALVVLDVMLPGMDGFSVLRELRRDSQLPVLMLTARGEDVDAIVGLELGADDYLAKPFNPRLLAARLRALARRPTPERAELAGPLQVGDLLMDRGARRVRVGGRPVELTGAEFNVLAVLLEAAGSVVTKEAICRQALGRPLAAFDRSVDMHVSNLRRKLGPLPGGEARIETIRGAGYQYLRAP